MTEPRSGYVQIYRLPAAELLADLPAELLGIFLRLLLDADHRTARVYGTIRELAPTYGFQRRETFRQRLRQLETRGLIAIDRARNQWADGLGFVTVLPYFELTRAGAERAPASRSAGAGGGPDRAPASRSAGAGGGPDRAPAHAVSPAQTSSEEVKKEEEKGAGADSAPAPAPPEVAAYNRRKRQERAEALLS